MFLWLKTLYRKRAVTWPFIFYTIIWTLSVFSFLNFLFFSNITKQNWIIRHLFSNFHKTNSKYPFNKVIQCVDFTNQQKK
ncbi:hypothetical protein CKY07_12780 [Enterococcus faecium]|nr:hypothetical protein CKY07_12780 [Enterococcus faecium]